MYFFSVRMKNVQTDVNHKSCKHNKKAILMSVSLTQHFDPHFKKKTEETKAN